MYTALKDDYANVTRDIRLLYLKCETCTKRRVHPKKGLVVKHSRKKVMLVVRSI